LEFDFADVRAWSQEFAGAAKAVAKGLCSVDPGDFSQSAQQALVISRAFCQMKILFPRSL
jgi:hypothetical protein